jgi:hypothetical protein
MFAGSSRSGELVFRSLRRLRFYDSRRASTRADGYGCELDPGYLAVQLGRLSAQRLEPKLISDEFATRCRNGIKKPLNYP